MQNSIHFETNWLIYPRDQLRDLGPIIVLPHEVNQGYQVLFNELVCCIEGFEQLHLFIGLLLGLVVLPEFEGHFLASDRLMVRTHVGWHLELAKLLLWGYHGVFREFLVLLTVEHAVFDNLIDALIKFLELTF